MAASLSHLYILDRFPSLFLDCSRLASLRDRPVLGRPDCRFVLCWLERVRSFTILTSPTALLVTESHPSRAFPPPTLKFWRGVGQTRKSANNSLFSSSSTTSSPPPSLLRSL